MLICILSLFLNGCDVKEKHEIEPPESWQSHLKPANLAAAYTPRIEETIYVPIYSHIYNDDHSRVTLLVGTLSVRNTDRKVPIVIKSVDYYGTDGKLLNRLLKEPVLLDPYASADVVIPRSHTAGGSGANFVVEWMAAESVTEPLAEAVMVSVGSSENVSFISRGVVTSRTEKPSKKK